MVKNQFINSLTSKIKITNIFTNIFCATSEKTERERLYPSPKYRDPSFIKRNLGETSNPRHKDLDPVYTSTDQHLSTVLNI